MKRLVIYFIVGISLSAVFWSCSKTEDVPMSTSSFTIVNAMVGVPTTYTLYTKINYGKGPTDYSVAPQIPLNSYKLFSGYLGDLSLSFSSKTDTATILYRNTLRLESGGVYSLFLSGTPDQPEQLFLQEEIPPHYAAADSVVGVRFLNLLTGSDPVTVNLKDMETTLEAGPILYKEATPFHPYSIAKSKQPSGNYGFEIRDQQSGELITTYTLSSLATLQSKNVTIVLKGIPGGTGTSAQSALMVNVVR